MELTLLAAAAIAIATAVTVVAASVGTDRDARRSRIDLLLAGVMGGLLVGRVTAMLLGGTNPLARPADLLIVRGGVDPVGATLGALATVAVLRRRAVLPMLDRLALPSLAGLAAWHGACLVRSSCLGTPSDLPWAFAEAGSTISRHPVELYAALLLATAALLLWRARGAAPGVLAGWALVAATAARLATEPMRPTLGSGRVAAYTVGLAVATVATAFVWFARRGGPESSVHSGDP